MTPPVIMPSVDEDFRALPLDRLADAALQAARDYGVAHAEVRIQRNRRSVLGLHDSHLAVATDETGIALGVRVLVDGVRGFASTDDLSPAAAADAARRAVELAVVSSPLALLRVELAPAPVEARREWTSRWLVDPFEVPRNEQVALLEAWSARLLASALVTHVDASLVMLKEQRYFADVAGSSTLQQRILLHPEVTVVSVDRDGWRAEAMRTLAPPTARGWEYVNQEAGWDWAAELAALPELVAERLYAPGVTDGLYDLVIDPTNLWRTVHETIGHATEIDRTLGHEATVTGDTVLSPLRLGELTLGSELLNVEAERTTPHGCATVGYDDEGVAATRWTLVEDGVLTGFQVDRATAATGGEEHSNGCAHAPSAAAAPVPRCANVNLAAHQDGPDLADLVSAVDRGFYVVGDAGFVADRSGLHFRAGAQRVYEIVAGQIRGQVRDVAYEWSAPAFWTALTAVGGPNTYQVGGTSTCGKGEPRAIAWTSHGSPAGLFTGVPVVSTAPREAA